MNDPLHALLQFFFMLTLKAILAQKTIQLSKNWEIGVLQICGNFLNFGEALTLQKLDCLVNVAMGIFRTTSLRSTRMKLFVWRDFPEN